MLLLFEPFQAQRARKTFSFSPIPFLSFPFLLTHAQTQSELDINPGNSRFRCILEQFMILHGGKCHCFYRQCDMIQSLQSVAAKVKAAKPNRRDQILQEALRHIVIPNGAVLPVNPSYMVKGLMIDKCRWLDSFTVPLWLVFENFDDGEDPLFVIFKAGDDLRQDALTVQMIQIMDNVSCQIFFSFPFSRRLFRSFLLFSLPTRTE